MDRFNARTGEWCEAHDRLCSLFDLGGHASGTSTTTANLSGVVQFIPSVNEAAPPVLVSPYPAGQGLSTLNSAYPGSAAYLPGTYATAAGAATSSPSLTTLLLLGGAVALGAWFLLRKHR
jgi:hypothetical protein